VIDCVDLVFAMAPPDLTDPRLVGRIRSVVSHAAWVRWSAVIGGTVMLVAVLALYVSIVLPKVSGAVATGRITAAGHVFFALTGVLGIIALLFGARLFRDVAPYRIDAETLASLRLERAKVVGFGPWLSVGGRYARYQRLRIRTGAGEELNTPYIRLTQAIWLLRGDTAWLAVDPAGRRAPLFLGVARVVPDVVRREGEVGFREYYQALELHLAQADPRRRETLLRVIGAARR
jgi:hypothetical protein